MQSRVLFTATAIRCQSCAWPTPGELPLTAEHSNPHPATRFAATGAPDQPKPGPRPDRAKSSLRAQQCRGDDADTVGATVCVRSGGYHNRVEQGWTDLLLQPQQVLDVAGADFAGDLDLQRNDSTVGALDDEVDLVLSAEPTKLFQAHRA